MTETYTIYHNPRCSKSRMTLKLLRREGAKVDIVKYMETPPSPELLVKALKTLGRDVVLRKGEDAYYTHIHGQEKKLQDAQIAALLQEYPEILQRPLVVAPDGRMVMGRPPENVLQLFQGAASLK